MKNIDINKIREYINNGSLNFLIGSGLPNPFIPLLSAGTEECLQKAEDEKDIILEKKLKLDIFTKILLPNLSLIQKQENSKNILEKYKKFIRALNIIIAKRKHNLIHRQINIFTTNYDILLELALESCKIDYNDGFSGRFSPTYNSDNFKKTIFKRGMFLDSSSEIPYFNILKLHGSISWTTNDSQEIILRHPLEIVNHLNEIKPEDNNFLSKYNRLIIINPSHKKFLDTVLLDIYSDLLRIYSSELEKQNSILFVCGFSFNDEHIYRITLKAANANPTLKIFILPYRINPKFLQLQQNAKNNNIEILNKQFDISEITTFFEKIGSNDE